MDICETKINMVCYRDSINDIINYSFEDFSIAKSSGNNLWNKVLGIKRALKYSKDFNILQKMKEKSFLIIFIYFFLL